MFLVKNTVLYLFISFKLLVQCIFQLQLYYIFNMMGMGKHIHHIENYS